jgi:hypothetical protein
MNPKTIRTALATRLETISGLRVAPSPRDQVNPPMAVISGPDPLTYGETWDAGHRLSFTVRVLVSRGSEDAAQDKLDAFMSDDDASSLYAAVEADKSLGGAVASAQVVSADNSGQIEVNNVSYLAVDFTVDVMT